MSISLFHKQTMQIFLNNLTESYSVSPETTGIGCNIRGHDYTQFHSWADSHDPTQPHRH